MQEIAADQISNVDAPRERSPEADCISSAIGTFRVIRCQWLQKDLDKLFILLILVIAVDLLLNGTSAIGRDVMLVAIAIDIILFRELVSSIPSALEIIWERGIVIGFPEDTENVNASENRKKMIEQKYCDFIEEFKRSLNSSLGQISMGAILALLVLIRLFCEFWLWLPSDFWMGLIYLAGGRVALIEGIWLHLHVFLTQYYFEDPLGFLSGVIVDPLLGFLLGLMAWKMYTTGRYIGFLNKRFRLDPLMWHPDGHGGLGCLGKIYILIASMMGIWVVLLIGWLVLGEVMEKADFSIPLVVEMLVLLLFITRRTFISPVFGFHKLMQKKKELIIRSLDLQISKAFTQKANPAMRPDEIKEIKRIEEAYDQVSGFSVWPFGKMALVSIALSQILTIMGGLVSFYEMCVLIGSVAREFALWR
jgi:hypothetical protein